MRSNLFQIFFFFCPTCVAVRSTKKQTAKLKVYGLSAQNRGWVKNNPGSHEALSAQWAVVCNKKYWLRKPLSILTEAVLYREGHILYHSISEEMNKNMPFPSVKIYKKKEIIPKRPATTFDRSRRYCSRCSTLIEAETLRRHWCWRSWWVALGCRLRDCEGRT